MGIQANRERSLRNSLIGALTLALATTAACTSPGKRTGIGAAGGGFGGAAIGGAIGGWKGAAIGGAIGAATGGAVGNVLDKQAKELEQVAETKRTEDGVMVNLRNDVLFDTGKADLKDNAVTQINKVGDILAKYPQDRIRIAGFTDSVGEADYNQKLSESRAETVKRVLTERGVKEEQMMWKGFGESNPVADNKSNAGRSKNRRVELKIDVPQEKAG